MGVQLICTITILFMWINSCQFHTETSISSSYITTDADEHHSSSTITEVCVRAPELLILGAGKYPKIVNDVSSCSNITDVKGHYGVGYNTIEEFASIVGDLKIVEMTTGKSAPEIVALTKFYYNPTCASAFSSSGIVYVTGSGDAKELALRLRRSGSAKLMYYGPNVVHCKEAHLPKEIERYVTPSDGVSDTLKHYMPQDSKFYAWPVGVDVGFWSPTKNFDARKGNALIYLKNDLSSCRDMISSVRSHLESQGIEVTTMTYGKYSKDEYRAALRNSTVAIFFTESESQGIALFESWSVDIPTFCFIGKMGMHEYSDKLWFSEPAPYMTPDTGFYFSNINQFKTVLSWHLQHKLKFSPRRWILAHGAWNVSAARIWSDMLSDWLRIHNATRFC